MTKIRKINTIPLNCDDEGAYWSSFHKEITGNFNKNNNYDSKGDYSDERLEKELDEFYYGNGSDLDFTPGCNKR